MTILTTKKLKENQKLLLLQAGVSFVEFDAIKIEFTSFKAPNTIKNAIFTSQNGVNSVFEKNQIIIENCFCVGEKTKALLEKYEQNVIKTTEYASELSAYLVENHKNDSFQFFCGNIRSDEIPTRLKENHIPFEETVVYNTILTPKKFDRTFDAILFFSPSGVRSYFEVNNAISNKTVAVCIGTTTETEAKKFVKDVIISNSTTVESVIAKAVKILKN